MLNSIFQDNFEVIKIDNGYVVNYKINKKTNLYGTADTNNIEKTEYCKDKKAVMKLFESVF